MAELNKHYDCRHLLLINPLVKLTMIIFHTANQTPDSLHNDHSAVCTTFHHCIDLKTTVVGKQLMICVHATSSAKGHSIKSLLEKPTSIRSAYLYNAHTHAHGSICMYTCSCMPATLSPSPSPSSHTLIV